MIVYRLKFSNRKIDNEYGIGATRGEAKGLSPIKTSHSPLKM